MEGTVCHAVSEQLWRLGNTKNGKKRFIPINSVVMSILKEAHKNKVCEYVFVNHTTETRYSDLKRSFNALCIKAN